MIIIYFYEFLNHYSYILVWGKVLGYGLDGPGSTPGGNFSLLLHVQIGLEIHSASCKMSTGGQRRPSIGLAILPLASALTVYMWTLASTSPWTFAYILVPKWKRCRGRWSVVNESLRITAIMKSFKNNVNVNL